jgi:copper(I)-binding protein
MKIKLNDLTLAGLFMALTTLSVHAEVKVDNAWVRLLPPTSKMTAAYMTLKSDRDDRLVGASSDVANVVEIHQSKMTDGVMSMEEVGCLDLPAGQVVELKPQSYHLMVMGLKVPLSEGDVHRFILEFEEAGELEVTLPVKAD